MYRRTCGNLGHRLASEHAANPRSTEDGQAHALAAATPPAMGHKEQPMGTITTSDSTEIFYKDWGSRHGRVPRHIA